jgi:short-subunit dehydrogenase
MTVSTRALAIVTGASSGIGFELAKQFAGNGYDLLICAEDDGIERAAGELCSNGAQVSSLQEELADTGVVLTALMPGPTETNFFHRAEMDDTPVGQSSKDDPAQVARQGFEALMDARDKVLAGSLKSRAQGQAAKVLPDKLKATMHRGMAEPES